MLQMHHTAKILHIPEIAGTSTGGTSISSHQSKFDTGLLTHNSKTSMLLMPIPVMLLPTLGSATVQSQTSRKSTSPN